MYFLFGPGTLQLFVTVILWFLNGDIILIFKHHKNDSWIVSQTGLGVSSHYVYYRRVINTSAQIAGAQYRLGILYYTGEGVKQDQTYSKLLMTKARDGGMKEAEDFMEKHF